MIFTQTCRLMVIFLTSQEPFLYKFINLFIFVYLLIFLSHNRLQNDSKKLHQKYFISNDYSD